MKDYAKAATDAIKEYMRRNNLELTGKAYYSPMIDAFGLYADETASAPHQILEKNVLLLSAIRREDGTFYIEEGENAHKYLTVKGSQKAAI